MAAKIKYNKEWANNIKRTELQNYKEVWEKGQMQNHVEWVLHMYYGYWGYKELAPIYDEKTQSRMQTAAFYGMIDGIKAFKSNKISKYNPITKKLDATVGSSMMRFCIPYIKHRVQGELTEIAVEYFGEEISEYYLTLLAKTKKAGMNQYIFDYTIKEIAETSGISVRAAKKLKSYFSTHINGSDPNGPGKLRFDLWSKKEADALQSAYTAIEKKYNDRKAKNGRKAAIREYEKILEYFRYYINKEISVDMMSVNALECIKENGSDKLPKEILRKPVAKKTKKARKTSEAEIINYDDYKFVPKDNETYYSSLVTEKSLTTFALVNELQKIYPEATVNDIADAFGYSKATVRKYLHLDLVYTGKVA